MQPGTKQLRGTVAVTVLISSIMSVVVAQPAVAATPVPQIVKSGLPADGQVAKVTCPAGTGLVGGGVQGFLVANLFDQVTDGLEANAPDESTPNTWKVQAKRGKAVAYAMCVAGAPTPTIVASDWSAPAQVARATCPAGTGLVGGGQDARLHTNLAGQVMDDTEDNAPNEGNAAQWTVQLKYGQARAFAMCLAGAPTPTIVASAWSIPSANALVTCPAGTGLIGGGQDARLVTALAGNITDGVEENTPDQANPNTWKSRLHKGQARAFAMCVAGAPTPTVVSSVMGGDHQVESVTCPAGTGLVGGGFDSLLHANGLDVVTDSVETSAPSADTPNTWFANAHTGRAQAYAMCTP